MNKRALLALLLAVVLLAATSCSLIVKDEKVDRETVVLEAAGRSFTKGEFNDALKSELEYMEYMYSMYGMRFDSSDPEVMSNIRNEIKDSFVEKAVLENKQEELGITLTDDEKAEATKSAEENYQSYFDSIKNYDFADTELTGEDLEKAVVAKMESYDYPTKEQMIADSIASAMNNKLRSEIIKEVAVTDDDTKAEYDRLVEADRTKYTGDPASFGSALTNRTAVYYTPAGYRYVKHILVKFDEAHQTAIDEIESKLTDKNSELANAGEGTDVTALDAEIAALKDELTAAREEGYRALETKLAEIQAKLDAGEDFDALVEEYGEDPGMKSSPTKETGYPVSADSTNWVTEFKDAAMALASVGDVSAPVRSTYGVHFIKYQSDITEGAVDFETVKDTIASNLLLTKQNECYDTTVAAWVDAASTKFYADRLN